MRSTIINTVLMGLVTAVCLLALEFLLLPLWATGSLERERALLGFVATPNSIVDDTAINEWGYTGDLLSNKEIDTNVTRILTLGGSALFNRRMTERMKEDWQQKLPNNLEVTGGALRTHTTRASLIKLEYFFSAYDFDYVLIYHGVNDLWANNVSSDRFQSDYAHLDPWYKRSNLLDSSLLARFSYNLISSRHGVFPGENSNAADFEAVETFEQNMRRIIAIAMETGAVPVLMTFASHIPDGYSLDRFRNYSLGYNNPDHYDECPVELWGTPEYVQEGLKKNNQVLHKLASELNLPIIDLDKYMSSDITNFGDFVHLSESGTQQLVEIVGKKLQDLESDNARK